MVKISRIHEVLSKLELQSKVQTVSKKRIRSLQLILDWSFEKKHLTEDEYNSLSQRLKRINKPQQRKIALFNKPDILRPQIPQKAFLYIIPILLFFMLLSGFLFFTKQNNNVAQSELSPQELRAVGKTLRFQGILLGDNQKPIDKKVDSVFRLYGTQSGGRPIYEGKCVGKNALNPSFDGQVSVIIGSDCGMKKIPEEVMNTRNLYLGITVGRNREMRPRFAISPVDYAKNSAKVNGMTLGVDESSIPFIDDDGKLVIGASSPSIRSTEGEFSLEGETVVIKTSEETAGSIILSPDLGGNVVVETGKIGIGKDNPESELDVVGNIGFTGSMFLDGENSSFYQSNGGSISFYSDRDIDDLSVPILSINNSVNKGLSVNGSIYLSDVKPKIVTTSGKDLMLGDKDTGNIIVTSGKKIGLGTDQLLEQVTIGGNTAPFKNNTVNLGSPTSRWAKTYTNELILGNEGIGGFWQRKGGSVLPTKLDDDILLGSETAQNALIKFSGKQGGISWINNGLLGLGTKNPHYLFSALTSNSNGSTISLSNTSTADNTSTNVLRLQLGSSPNSTNAHFIEFYAGSTDDNNGRRVGGIRLNNGGVVYETTGADFAEYMDIEEDIDEGYIVGINANGKRKANAGDEILGVVSASEGFVGNAKEKNNGVLVGLIGQVKTYVSTENGQIKPGDLISVGSIPGYGKKASPQENTVGIVIDENEDIQNELNPLLCPENLQQLKADITCGKVTVLLRSGSAAASKATTGSKLGTVEIGKGKTDVRIYTDELKDISHIQLTAISTKPVAVAIAEKNICSTKQDLKCDNSFVVTTDKNVDEIIKIQWQIIN